MNTIAYTVPHNTTVFRAVNRTQVGVTVFNVMHLMHKQIYNTCQQSCNRSTQFARKPNARKEYCHKLENSER